VVLSHYPNAMKHLRLTANLCLLVAVVSVNLAVGGLLCAVSHGLAASILGQGSGAGAPYLEQIAAVSVMGTIFAVPASCCMMLPTRGLLSLCLSRPQSAELWACRLGALDAVLIAFGALSGIAQHFISR
jgi:hypothetical protein